MWALLGRRTQLSIVAATAVATAWGLDAAWALATGQHPGVLKFASLAGTVIWFVFVGVAALIWRPLWRWLPALGRRFFPDLNGVWKGTLVSTWTNPETKTGIPPIEATLTISQGLLDTQVTLKTGESTSHSTRATLERQPEPGRFRVWYTYNNDPLAQVQHRSSPHEGVAFVEIEMLADPHLLTGRYYTTRKTTGDMTFKRAAAP